MVRRRIRAHPTALHSGTRLTRRRAWPLSRLRRLTQSVNPIPSASASRLWLFVAAGCAPPWWSRGNSFRKFRDEFAMDLP